MKTILVPTDFSPSAENAMNYAAQLALVVDSSVCLVHMYQIPVSMNDVPVLMVSAEELKNNADNGLNKAKEQLAKKYPLLSITTESRLGDVVEELKDISADKKPVAIVVGKHGASGVERFLFGSTTLSIIRHLNHPVVAVPDITTSFQIKNIALAVDHPGSIKHENAIREFIEAVNGRMHIVHVQESGKDVPGLKNILPDLHPVYQTVRNEEFIQGINRYAQSHSIDLLIILPHKHSFLERLFFKTHTAELIDKLKIPVMTFGIANSST